jgi:threonine synthase
MERAVAGTGGACVLVEDAEVLQEQKRLAGEGFLVEPTAAVASAAALKALGEGLVKDSERVVVPLTGSGLKKPPA